MSPHNSSLQPTELAVASRTYDCVMRGEFRRLSSKCRSADGLRVRGS
jgi:hypothetical protein